MNRNRKMKKENEKIFISLAFITLFLGLLGSLFIVAVSPRTETVSYDSSTIETQGTINSIIQYFLKRGSSNFITGANIGLLTAGDDTGTANGWNKTFHSSSTGNDEARTITADPSGNIFVGGYGNNLVGGSTSQDMWIKKFATDGTENLTHWNLSFDKTNSDMIWDIVSDINGQIYIAGEGNNLFNASTNFDWWIKKIQVNGTEDLTWNKTVFSPSSGTDEPKAITIDSNNNIFVVGYGNNLVNGNSQQDWWIKKYNSSGSENGTNWNLSFDKGSQDAAEDIVIDSSGNIFVAGEGTNLVSPTSGQDWWIKKFLANGTEDSTWNKSFGTQNTELIYGIKIDNSGNLYMVGSSNNLVNTSSANDWLLKKYNSSGSEDTTNWNKSFEGRGKSANDEAYDLVIDSNNNVYVVGYAGSLTNSSSSNDWWIKKYNSSGSEDTTNWNLSFDGKNNNGDIAYKALINSSNLYIAGSGNNLNSSTSVNDWWIKQINTTTDPTDCGTITSSLTLTGNKTATGNCYIIGSNNIIIDGSGFSITSNGSGMGVNNTAGYSNVTIKNLIINNFSTGIYLNNSVNHTIWNNTIQSVNASDSPGIKLISVNNSNLSFNNITIIGINTNAIYFGSSNNNLIYKNNILTLMSGSTVFSSNTSSYNNITSNNITFYSAVTGIDVNENAVSYLISSNTILYQGTGTGVGIDMDAINDSTIINNNITANTGVRITASAPMYSNNNTIESNSIVTVGSSDYGISLGQFGYSWWDVNNTLILNNNITATHYLIYDNSSDSQIQKLVYNNSFGEIRWIDNGSGSFLRGLDLNMTQRGVFGLGSQIFIDNNTVALNTSVFKMGVNKINSSANITVYTLNNWSSINQISFLSNYTTNSSEIRQKGTNCTNCFITSFSSGTLLFNVTSFSSYAGDSIGGVDSTNPSVFSLLPANNEIVNPVQTIEISANVTDDIGVQLVSANITSPNGTIINLTLSNGTGFSTKFNNSYTISNLLGTYTISFFANDTSNNINSTETTNFMVYSVDSETSDLTQWLMFGRYLNHTRWDGVSFPTISGLSNTSFTTGGDIYSASPVVVNGYVYVGSSDNTFYQLNASNISQKISNFTTGGTIYPSSAVVNGYVYVGSNDNKVYQLSASDVSQRIANFTTNSWIKSSPAVANGYLYVGSLDFQIYQLNASNIAQKISNFTTLDSIESSPAVSNGYVYVGSWDNTIYQLNATNISQQISSYTTNDDVYSSPAVANGYVYVGSDDNNVYQLNASNISQQIANFTGAGNIIRSSPAIANGYVYVGSYDNKIYQLNASNISQHIANFTTGYYVPSSPTIANGYVYVGSYDNKVYQLNASNISQHIANFTTGDDVQSSPAVANGYVYVGSADNKIYQLNASNIASGVISGDTAPPSVSGVLPIQNTTFNVSQTVIIAANVTDDVNVSRVFANVSEPNGTIKNIELTYRSADLYNTTFTAPALIGSYNVTFIANDSSNNINSTVTTNFTVLDVVNPSVSGVLPIQNTTFNVSQTVIIAANVTDDVNVSRVFANVSEPNGTIKVVELTYRSANLYNTTFTAPNLTGGYNITFIANDSSNNINSTVITNFTVLDVINPSVSGVLPIQNTTFNVSQTVIIAANVTDDVNVSRVFANVSEPNGTIKIVELLFDSGNRYNTTFTAPNLTGGYNVTFIANDSSNNQNRTITTNFSVLDVTNPLVSGVLPIQNSTFNISQTVIVAANVTDDVNVSRVFANISEPNGTIKVVELVFDSINRYNTTFTAPNLTGGYNVTFIANDSSNNINSTVTTNFTLLDAVNPSVSGVLPIQNSTFNVSQTVIIAANVTDNYNVSRVFANISEPNGTIKVVELTYRSADLYNTTFTAPNLTGGYNVTFITNDSSNNINTTVTTNFTILDIINPSVSGVLPIQNSTFNVSQTVIIAANVTDDVNVSRVFANISEPNGTIKVV
ncbi:PQQ-binding-like beta-propeller repeat protein, partial [Candidatus Woesearchaeota archaeon]|nr:PQQ-binding-like beta-propeller repeat protein [Candidatus Woesearchaeota archaeon]